MTLPLFAECALPGCVNPADEAGGPCPECTSLFDGAVGGWTIRRSEGGAPETAEQVVDRKTEQRIAQALATTPERKQHQVCWLCEERRTCTKEPGGWECDSCRGERMTGRAASRAPRPGRGPGPEQGRLLR